MIVNFNEAGCQSHSSKNIFGLCDDPAPTVTPAYINENNGESWIAVVENEERYKVTFTAIDNCIELFKGDGSKEKRCDGMLTYNANVIFVELKDRSGLGNAWVEDAIPQLRSSIDHFERSKMAENFAGKLAYISNKQHPKFKSSQQRRMEEFFEHTGYILRIHGRIKL